MAANSDWCAIFVYGSAFLFVECESHELGEVYWMFWSPAEESARTYLAARHSVRVHKKLRLGKYGSGKAIKRSKITSSGAVKRGSLSLFRIRSRSRATPLLACAVHDCSRHENRSYPICP